MRVILKRRVEICPSFFLEIIEKRKNLNPWNYEITYLVKIFSANNI